MPNIKQKQIELDVVILPKIYNLSVSVSIPFECSPEYISLLMGNNPCEMKLSSHYNGLHESSLAFALFNLVREKLCGSPLEVARSKVDHVSCASHQNSFVISWNTQGTGSALRKTIGIVLKCLSPNALFSRYSHNIKLLNGKADRAEFNYIANKMIDGINKHIHFVAVGKINPSTDFSGLLKTAVNKFSSSSKSLSGDSKSPEKYPENKIEWNKLTCSDGTSAIIVADYIQHKGFGLRICGKHIIIYSKSWNSKLESLKQKDSILSYISAKYDKLDNLAELFLAYHANSIAMGNSSAILGLTKKIKPSEILIKNLS
jgi:hypothetical protein